MSEMEEAQAALDAAQGRVRDVMVRSTRTLYLAGFRLAESDNPLRNQVWDEIETSEKPTILEEGQDNPG